VRPCAVCFLSAVRLQRVRRVLHNVFAVVCLLACAVSALMWFRSHAVRDSLHGHRGQHFFELFSVAGSVGLKWDTDRSPQVAQFWRYGNASVHRSRITGPTFAQRLREECDWHFLGFGGHDYEVVHHFVVAQGQAATRSRLLAVPYWSLVALTALPPALRLTGRFRRRGKAATDLCAACGYDLRASTEFGRCPECGLGIGPAQ
jgi:hypothetical protein